MRNYANQTGGRLQSRLWVGSERNINDAPYGEKGIIIMNDLKIWNYEDTTIRTLEIDGEMWFVGKDVTSILGYANASKALADHVDDDDKLNNETLSSLGQRGGWLINESGVYALIFGSKLPTAKKFKRWVTSEVLPSIRKNGSYSIDTALTPELQVLIQHERMMQEQKKQLDAVQNKVEAIQEIFTLTPENWKKDVRVAVGKLSMSIAEDYSMMQELYEQIYALLEDRAGADLEARLRNRRKRMEQNGSTKTAVKKITKLDIIEDDRKLKEIFTSILREMSAKYI